MAEQFIIEELGGGVTFEMLLVEGGRFLMGSEDEEAATWESPVHEVEVGDFYIGKYLVSQQVWKSVHESDENPSRFQGDNRPVERVSWQDVQEFLKKLNNLTGRKYRLLSEAEWEYAARGGKKSEGYKYSGSNKLKDVGWYEENSYGETKPVGLKYPNELGLYDMSGNVWEWVEDQWHDNYEGAPINGSAWVDRDEGAERVFRGGGWDFSPQDCRVSFRLNGAPTTRGSFLGFRLGLSLQSVG